ncbi:hypothetical protein DPMN_122141 [Dreissena polymorpha]|uniref:Uncharacterized protein n=1 Tax=Dreissena polymorpha TaxID=45954 RepID=A0A9D4GRX9_DREPO|nr:hypothetical protein DPMN_122141 [Dreissena polymorpha]
MFFKQRNHFRTHARYHLTNILTIFHQDWTINVASRVLTRKNAPPPSGHVFFNQPASFSNSVQDNWTINCGPPRVKNVPAPHGSHVFSSKGYHFLTHPRYHVDNLLSKFHYDRGKQNVASRVLTRKNARPRPPGGHVFSTHPAPFLT